MSTDLVDTVVTILDSWQRDPYSYCPPNFDCVEGDSLIEWWVRLDPLDWHRVDASLIDKDGVMTVWSSERPSCGPAQRLKSVCTVYTESLAYEWVPLVVYTGENDVHSEAFILDFLQIPDDDVEALKKVAKLHGLEWINYLNKIFREFKPSSL
jgi:hypothetical protein